MDEEKREVIENLIEEWAELEKVPRNNPEYWTACVVYLFRSGISLHSCVRYFGCLTRTERIQIKWEYLYSKELAKNLPEQSLIQDYAKYPVSFDRINNPDSMVGNILWVWVLLDLSTESKTIDITQELIKGRNILIPHKEMR